MLFVCDVENFECVVKMDKDQWMYDNIMYEEVDMNEQTEDEASVNEEHIDCRSKINPLGVNINTSHIRFIIY